MRRIISIIITIMIIIGAVAFKPSTIQVKATEGTSWLAQSDVDYFTEKFMYTLSESEKALKIQEINNLNPDLEWNETNWDTVKEMSDDMLDFLSQSSKFFPNSIEKSYFYKLGKGSLGYISSLIEICKNIRYINETDTNNLEKAYHGLKIFNIACKTMGFTRDPSVAALTTALDIMGETLMIADVLYKQYIKEDLAFYEMDLLMAYYSGEELPTTPSVQRAFIDTLGEDNFYQGCSALYLKYSLMRMGDSLRDPKEYNQSEMYQWPQEGDFWVVDPNEEVDQVRFAYNSYQMPMNPWYQTTTYTIYANTFPRNAGIGRGIALYYSSNTNVVTIDSNSGEMKPIAPGTANVYARSNNGVEGSCKITVLPYRVNKNGGQYEITEHISVSGENNIWIPGHINDSPVTKIAVDAFSSSSAKGIIIPNTIITIEKRAFCWCSNIKDIVIPDSVKSMEESAFSHCSSLEQVSLSNGLETIGERAFYECEKLKSITIPSSVKSIGKQAFGACSKLESINVDEGNPYYYSIDGVLYDRATNTLLQYPAAKSNEIITLPETVNNIGEYAFQGADRLKQITISENTEEIGKYAFYKCDNLSRVIIRYGTKSIGNYAFNDCASLDTITIPESITSIGSGAFINCSSLKSLYLPSNLQTVSNYMLQYCTALEEINIPNGIKTIGSGAFYACTNLKQVYLPESIESVESQNFIGCPALEEIIVDRNNHHYYSDDGVLFTLGNMELVRYPSNKEGSTYSIPNNTTKIKCSAFEDCCNLCRINFPNSITRIENAAFRNCGKINEVILPDSITDISDYTFAQCSNLQKIRLPNSLSNLGGYAFKECTKLKYLRIPNVVNAIGDYCFEDCTNLRWIDLPNSITSIGNYAFHNCENLGNINLSNGMDNSGGIFFNCLGLQQVRIPDNTEKICYNTFAQCDNLKTLGVPKSLKTIEWIAFSNCYNLNDIYYEGSHDDWKKISIDNSNTYIINATIHFNQSLPTDTFEPLHKTGDTNLDNTIDIRDATAIQRHLVELEELNEEQLFLSDTNDDLINDIADATALQMYLAEYDVKLGVHS